MRGIHRWPVNSPHKGPVTRKMFPFDDVIMTWNLSSQLRITQRMSHGYVSRLRCDNIDNVASLGKISLIARFMGPTWGPSGADRTQAGPMLAPWTLLSGMLPPDTSLWIWYSCLMVCENACNMHNLCRSHTCPRSPLDGGTSVFYLWHNIFRKRTL